MFIAMMIPNSGCDPFGVVCVFVVDVLYKHLPPLGSLFINFFVFIKLGFLEFLHVSLLTIPTGLHVYSYDDANPGCDPFGVVCVFVILTPLGSLFHNFFVFIKLGFLEFLYAFILTIPTGLHVYSYDDTNPGCDPFGVVCVFVICVFYKHLISKR